MATSAGGAGAQGAAGAGVQALGALAHHDEVDLAGLHAGQRAGGAGPEPGRAQVDVLVEREAQLEQQAALEHAGRHGRVPTAPSRIASCPASSASTRVGQHLAGAVVARGAQVVLGGLDARAGRRRAPCGPARPPRCRYRRRPPPRSAPRRPPGDGVPLWSTLPWVPIFGLGTAPACRTGALIGAARNADSQGAMGVASGHQNAGRPGWVPPFRMVLHGAYSRRRDPPCSSPRADRRSAAAANRSPVTG